MSKKNKEIPVYIQPLIETHCHLDYLEADDLSIAIEKTKDVNVERIITIAVSPDNLDKVQAISEAHTNDAKKEKEKYK